MKCSLEHGFRHAVFLSVGVVIADLALLGIAYGGVEAFLPAGDYNVAFWVQLLGGALLMSLGISNMLQKPTNTEGVKVVESSTLIFHNLVKGFFINILNPANFFEWVGTAGVLKTKYAFETYENVSFFSGALLAVFITELLVAYFAGHLRRFLSVRVVRFINIVMGSIFCSFGIWLFSEAYKNF
ncbi:MAG: LysE family transporter [Saprospiraceae bacterium]|nr:LysE family transporter [Saprospiraceae bacterium]